MTSIQQVQTARALENIVRSFLSKGIVPSNYEIRSQLSDFFSRYPAGNPVSINYDSFVKGEVASPYPLNLALETIVHNLEILYEVAFQTVDELMEMNSSLQEAIDRLRTRRKGIEQRIDDYLLAQTNADGYYYSVGDSFSDTTLVDFQLTSAYIDNEAGSVMLPPTGTKGLTGTVPTNKIALKNLQVTATGIDGQSCLVGYGQPSLFSSAVDHLTNTVWSIEVRASKRAEAVVVFGVQLGSLTDPVAISQISFLPHGVTPVQMFVHTSASTSPVLVDTNAASLPGVTQFGSTIKESADRIILRDVERAVDTVYFTLRKTQPDFIHDSGDGHTVYRYIFGASDLVFSSPVYDDEAVMVSTPLSIASDLSNEMVIDAISVTAEATTPQGTNIQYYVAADTAGTTLDEFDWHEIHPVVHDVVAQENIFRFAGASFDSKIITTNPAANDLQLIPPDSTSPDLTQRNPSPALLVGMDTYRIAKFTDDVLLNSVVLEEGFRMTTIKHTDLSARAVDGLDFWKNLPDTQVTTTYGSIDSGNDFFYGGDIGMSGRSVYVETYLYTLAAQETIISEFVKKDFNSRTWSVRVLLNGRSIAYMPSGTNSALIPWAFQAGANHIALLINIPDATSAVPSPYIGTVELMVESKLWNYGIVKLANWSYVDKFELETNQTTDNLTFTIYNGEIISLRQPTSNFRLQFQRNTQASPSAIRFRADLSRIPDNSKITPTLDGFRVRFSYGEADNGSTSV